MIKKFFLNNKYSLILIGIIGILVLINYGVESLTTSGLWPVKSFIQNYNSNLLKSLPLSSANYDIEVSALVNDKSYSKVLTDNIPLKQGFTGSILLNLNQGFDKDWFKAFIDFSSKLNEDNISMAFVQDLYSKNSKKVSLVKLNEFNNKGWNYSNFKELKEFWDKLNALGENKQINKVWIKQLVSLSSYFYLNFKGTELEKEIDAKFKSYSTLGGTEKKQIENFFLRFLNLTTLKNKEVENWISFYTYEINLPIKKLLQELYPDNYVYILKEIYKNNPDKKEFIEKLIATGNIQATFTFSPEYKFIKSLTLNISQDKDNSLQVKFNIKDINSKFHNRMDEINESMILIPTNP